VVRWEDDTLLVRSRRISNSRGLNLRERPYLIIVGSEEGGKPDLIPYVDSNGWITIGIGFNLSDATVRSKVFNALVYTDPALLHDLNDEYHPLGIQGEPWPWKSELSFAPWTIYVLAPVQPCQ